MTTATHPTDLSIDGGAQRSEGAMDRLARLQPSPRAEPVARPVGWLLAAVVLFNLWYLRDELAAVRDLNDGSFHAAYVRWASERVRAGRSPFDGLFTHLGLGFPVFHHYQVLPHVIAGVIGSVTNPDVVYRVSLYLLLALWPVALYVSSRLFGLSRGAAVGAAVIAPFVIALPGYGYERGSYTWAGYGMWSQLWGMWLFAFAVALAWRAVDQRRSLALAAAVAAATIASHALTGYLLLAVVMVFAFVTTNDLWTRLLRALVVVGGALAGSAWLLAPAFRDRAWTRNGLPDGTFWTDSYGARKILGWLVSGELFDAHRLPVITVLAGIGTLAAIRRARTDRTMRALLALAAVSLVLYFGRPTLGSIVDWLPARDDIFLHRMIVGVHLGGVLLAGVGLVTMGRAAQHLISRRRTILRASWLTGAALVATIVVLFPAWSQIRRSDLDTATWMAQQRAAERTDGADFAALVERTRADGGGRIYAGMLSNWGSTYRIGYVPAVIELLDLDADGVGFTGRVPALTEPSEARFDDTNSSDYELFGVRWAIFPDTQPAPPGGRLVEARGRHRLYFVPGSGLLQVVDVTTPISTDRRGIGVAVGAFLRSSMAQDAKYPLLNLDGRSGSTTPASPRPVSTAAPGRIDMSYDVQADGVVGGRVTAVRPATVVLKMSYHPRWAVTVDGRRAPVLMVAPGFLAVRVPAGDHLVEFHYRAVSGWETLMWFGLAACVLGLLAWADRRSRRRSNPPGELWCEPVTPGDRGQPVVVGTASEGVDVGVDVGVD